MRDKKNKSEFANGKRCKNEKIIKRESIAKEKAKKGADLIKANNKTKSRTPNSIRGKRKRGEQIVIEFNLSKSVAIITLIIIVIMGITTKEVVETIIEAKQQKALANETTTNTSNGENVTWVKGTTKDTEGNEVVETDANGNEVRIPVPKGYTASKIDGETSASKGFVIYEGDVDWSTILVGSDATESTSTASLEDTTSSDSNASDVNDNTANTENNTTIEEGEDSIIEIADNTSIVSVQNSEETTQNTTATEEATTVTQEEINIFNLQKTVNQYVWVPVDNINDIYGVDENGKLWGKLYSFSSSGVTPLNWTETNGIMNITDKTSYREPDVIPNISDYDIDSMLSNYGIGNETRYELLAQEMEQNFCDMIESIKKYGGFYIGRYETGGLSGTAVVRKMDTDIRDQTWYTMYKRCKNLKGSNENIETSMIWGSLWDETLQWLESSDATISTGEDITYELLTNSTSWGNYTRTTFTYIKSGASTPVETETKAMGRGIGVPTGSSSYMKTNNIYDIAGNMWEWTLENLSSNKDRRGGTYLGHWGSLPASSHMDYGSVGYRSYDWGGCRAVLLIQ